MFDAHLSRRDALLGLAALPFATLARAQGKYAFRSIEVDVSPLRATGDTFTPQVLAGELPGALAQSFAPYMGKGGYILRARIDSVSYGPTPSHPSFTIDATKDFIEGAALVIGPGGKVVASYPLMTSAGVSYDNRVGTEAYQHDRAAQLGEVFARWLPGQMGL